MFVVLLSLSHESLVSFADTHIQLFYTETHAFRYLDTCGQVSMNETRTKLFSVISNIWRTVDMFVRTPSNAISEARGNKKNRKNLTLSFLKLSVGVVPELKVTNPNSNTGKGHSHWVEMFVSLFSCVRPQYRKSSFYKYFNYIKNTQRN